MFLLRYFFCILLFASTSLFAQQPVKIHSHNDYSQLLPFWKAYNCGLNSIEVDIFLKNGVLYAAHAKNDIEPNNTLETMYLKPLSKVVSTHLGNEQELQLLIDLKSEAYSTLEAIEKVLKKYPELTNNPKLTFVISGYRPLVKDYKNYPNYILFDYQSLESIPTESFNKVSLISLSFKKFSSWNGVKDISESDLGKIKAVVEQAHSYKKPFRFWGAPDTPLAWKTFNSIGIDFINTDHPLECSNYFKKHTFTNNYIQIQIAFLSDIHFQDIYGKFSDTNYKGIFNNKTNKFTLLRTMDSQLHSTRIFNENYFALFATLDDMVAKGIKYVALPGDYTDDGQAIHLRGLQQILEEYKTTYGIQFFITTGNHDPVGPFAQESGKSDFMGIEGQSQGIYSKMNKNDSEKSELPSIITNDIKKEGYEGVFNYLKPFGFYPQENYLYWATPFSNYTAETYTYQKALDNAPLEKRMYDIVPEYTIPDASYVVEPTPNIWLLALDGNVYLPKDTINSKPSDPENYNGASIGYNNVLTNKTHLISWVKTIADEAKRLGKTLIAFSHYPMIDFNDDASTTLKTFFEGNKWQLERVPNETVAKQFSEAGITVHVAGHMHINDTGVRTFSSGKSLVNIQSPSLAAYIPGYKILTIKPNNIIEVNTITIDNVPHFNELFPLYEKEYAYLQQQKKPLWNYDILKTNSYHDFTMFHLKELVRLRFLKDDWVSNFKDFMLNISGEELLLLPYLDSEIDFEALLDNKDFYKNNWKLAKKEAELDLKETGFTLQDFKHWNGFDIIFDFYRVRNADVLAINDIGKKQIAMYQWLFKNYKTKIFQKNTNSNKQKLLEFYSIFSQFLNGAPSNNFIIDYNTGSLKKLD
ncbi:metallophosphoesterase [Lutibacter sp. B1]|uniref:metallophosphoesterase n=1 Tax=Lutibacter sp. B1 TaxID=2725996 RepID=UPI001456F15F|nr:metallophosphoesterase [Lutibacter sp. B1]NLP59108.1 metallophosphoesterase [Lutibacter sp. B1]